MGRLVRVYFYIFLISIGLFANCGNRQENRDEMTFRVDRAKLGEKYVNQELGFSFFPPKGCVPVPDRMLHVIRDSLATQFSPSEWFIIEPKVIFFDSENQFTCVVSSLPNITYSDSVIIKYQKAIKNQFSQFQVNQTNYYYHDFRMFQSLIVTSDRVQFKLFIPQPSNKSFQIDYVIPRTYYVEKIEAIESSIGSIEKR